MIKLSDPFLCKGTFMNKILAIMVTGFLGANLYCAEDIKTILNNNNICVGPEVIKALVSAHAKKALTKRDATRCGMQAEDAGFLVESFTCKKIL